MRFYYHTKTKRSESCKDRGETKFFTEPYTSYSEGKTEVLTKKFADSERLV
jgi:hypothetical protein